MEPAAGFGIVQAARGKPEWALWPGILRDSPCLRSQPPCRVMQQEAVLEIEVQDNGDGIRSSDIPQEGCRPLRPAHLADLRDEALAAAGVNSSQMVQGGRLNG